MEVLFAFAPSAGEAASSIGASLGRQGRAERTKSALAGYRRIRRRDGVVSFPAGRTCLPAAENSKSWSAPPP